MKCPNCGKEIANDSKFCEYCGTKLVKKLPITKKKLLPWLTGCLVVGIIALVIILIIQMASGAGYVDLGLPSGTKWKSEPKSDFYSYAKAKQKFGNELPTDADFIELQENCDWKWNGAGYIVTGPNGNSIILPAAGFINYSDNVTYEQQEEGYYWAVSSWVGNATYWFTIQEEGYELKSNISYSDDYPAGFSVILVKR